ncbi:hypothetical protein [Flavobacterium sp. H122]|uniref:hypothetical protein n=1 Tax=Flavobacterium sp. H122 TaxID=2529860 RepID=UPI0010AA9518|nr:hypothetical protein [Flavobacterium sp. H122]
METKTYLSFETTLDRSFEVYKKTFLIAGIAFLLLTVVLLMMFMTGVNFFFGFENFAEKMKTFNPEELSTEGTLMYFGGLSLIVILIAPFNAGILKIMKDADEGQEEPTISSLFYYINSKYFIPIVTTTIVLSLFGFILNIGLEKSIGGSSFGKVISMLISIAFSVLTLIALPNVIFKDMNPSEAIINSITNCSRNFLKILLLMIIALIIGYLGIIGLCIGIFFTFPIYFAMQYAIFKSFQLK